VTPADLPALEGEDWVALDELPPDAELDTVLAIIAEVHADGVAAVMSSTPDGTSATPLALTRGYDYPPRPKSGLPKDWRR
jgi:hypothetical protein